MKKFALKLTICIIIGFAVTSVIIAGKFYLLSKVSYRLPENRHIIITGASHSECAINDTIFNRSVNLSHSNALYLFDYGKLQHFLTHNPQIDTVLLSFHHGRLNTYVQQVFLSSHPQYLYILQNSERMYLFNHFSKTKFINAVVRWKLNDVFRDVSKKNWQDYFGGYLFLNMDKLQYNIEHQDEQPTDEYFYSTVQRDYLQKTVELCKEKNITLILINTPTYKPEIYGSIDELEEYRQKHLKGIPYLDYSAFALPDSCYGDIQHLNYRGARVFSKYLQQNLTTDLELLKLSE